MIHSHPKLPSPSSLKNLQISQNKHHKIQNKHHVGINQNQELALEELAILFLDNGTMSRVVSLSNETISSAFSLMKRQTR